MLSLVLLSHIPAVDSHIELWTIFEYHPNGTLYEYLEENSLDMQDALKLCASFISGLHYLHKDIQAATCQAKPGKLCLHACVD